MVDATAERIATLGGVPERPARLHSSPTATWDDYELGRADSQAHLGALDLVYRGVIEDHRDAIDETDEPDPVTQDMLIGQTGELEQYHWFVRSHLEDYAGGLANAGADHRGRRGSLGRRVTRRQAADAASLPATARRTS